MCVRERRVVAAVVDSGGYDEEAANCSTTHTCPGDAHPLTASLPLPARA